MTGAAGLAAGLLLSGGKPTKLLGNAAKLGAVAAVGGLAYKAWQSYQEKQTGAAQAHADNPSLANEYIFDWLESRLGAAGRRS